MKNKSLWKGLIVMLAAAFVMLVTPIQKVSAQDQVLNGTETLNWSSSYSGKMYGMDECYKYAFSIPSSGKVAFTINTVSTGCAGTGIDEVQILDASGTEIYTESIGEGLSTVSANLLAGDYTLRLCAGFWTGCKFSFTSVFQPSGETKTEWATAKNNEIGMATSYKLGKSVKAQFAVNDNVDIYKLKVTKNQYLNLTVSSKVQKMGIKFVNTFGDYTIENSEVTIGTHKYKYFLPKGTYYISFTKASDSDTGTYTFKTSASKIPATTITKVKNVKTYSYYKQIAVSFKRKSYVDGYQIQVARDKKFKKGKKTITCDSIYNKEIVTGLKKGTYYVRIRPYVTARKTNNYTSIYKNYYASWSKVKSVRVK